MSILVKGVEEKKLIMEQNLLIVKKVTASIQSISKSLLEKCNDLEQAIVGVSSIRNEQLAKVMIEQAIKQTLESFESTKKDVEDNRVNLAKLLPEEDRAKPITFLKEAEEEEESSGSIDAALLESDSESFFLFEEEEEEKNTKKRIFNEDDEYAYDGGFVQSDSVEPEVFEDSKYDKVFGVDHLNTPKKKKKKKSLRRSKRKNKGKIELYSDVPENEQYGDDQVDDLMVEEIDPDERAERFSAMDQGNCHQFLESLREEESIPLKKAIQASPWFKKRYNDILNTVRNNIGLQGSNRDALMVWDHIAEDAFKAGDDMPKITKGVIDDEHTICCFCNSRRRCTWLLELRSMLYPVGTKCGELVKAVTYFFFMLQEVVKDLNIPSSDAIDELDKAIYEVQEAHAGKARR